MKYNIIARTDIRYSENHWTYFMNCRIDGNVAVSLQSNLIALWCKYCGDKLYGAPNYYKIQPCVSHECPIAGNYTYKLSL